MMGRSPNAPFFFFLNFFLKIFVLIIIHEIQLKFWPRDQNNCYHQVAVYYICIFMLEVSDYSQRAYDTYPDEVYFVI